MKVDRGSQKQKVDLRSASGRWVPEVEVHGLRRPSSLRLLCEVVMAVSPLYHVANSMKSQIIGLCDFDEVGCFS